MAYLEKTIKSSGGDYTKLTDFETAMDGFDISGYADGVRAMVYDVPDDTLQSYWDGWAGSGAGDLTSTRRIVIQAYDPTDGLTDDGTTSRIEDKIVMFEGTYPFYATIIGLEFHVTNGDAVSWTGNTAAGQDLIVAKCMFRDSAYKGVDCLSLGAPCTAKMGGCLGKGLTFANYGCLIECNDADLTVDVINCTDADGVRGFYSNGSGTINTKNCVSVNESGAEFTNCIETTCLAEEDGDVTNADADDFTAPSTDDYRVYDTNSALYEAGTSAAESWFTTLCTTDFAGTGWRGTPAVGCFEHVAAGPTAKSVTGSLTISGALARKVKFKRAVAGAL